MHPAMKDLARRRAEDKRKADAKRNREPRLVGKHPALAAPYGTSSSYQPATDTCPAPFTPAADVYSPPAADTSTDYSGGGGSFDGGGSSGDW